MSWSAKLLSWTKPPSDNEEHKRDRTEREIREAILAHPRLREQPIKVYAKGSYANNTNVRLDSDIDINIEYYGGYYYDGIGDADDQISKAAAGVSEYTGPFPTFKAFKNEVEEALRVTFGSAVSRENKCITIREESTTLPADVVPCWEYRHFYRGWGNVRYLHGTVFYPDDGSSGIVNYPRQHHDNGVAKNNRTSTRYKKTVRAVKRLENEMVAAGKISDVPSYLIECLVYRCPDSHFAFDDYLTIIREVLVTVFHNTKGVEPTDESQRWLETNDIKFLFHPAQKWTRPQANWFTLAAWHYLGLS